jgi:SET domain-containing protein
LEAKLPISKDSFILEYCGEVIDNDTLMTRMATIYRNEKNHYFLNYGPNEVIDGFRKGSIARFANHSCEPNCRIEKWSNQTNFRNVEGEYRIGLFAEKNIYPGEELTYDYRFESFGVMQPCFCGSLECRGSFFLIRIHWIK